MRLTEADYLDLKKRTKGWDAKRLAKYGIKWPPVHGWRKRLLREYEGEPVSAKLPNWAKLRPDSDGTLEDLLYKEKKLTAQWYERISGNVAWGPGERERLDRLQDEVAMEIDHHIGRQEMRYT